jgi:hypothetical protein
MTAKIILKEQYVFIHAYSDTIFTRGDFESDEDSLEYAQELAREMGVNNMQVLRHIGYRHAELAT